MKYNLTRPMREADGKETKEGDGEVVTVGKALQRALLSDYNPATQQLPITPDEKAKRYLLWKRLAEADGARIAEVECTIEEAATLKAVAGVYGTLGYGQLVEFLDGKSG